METTTRKLLTINAEASLENLLANDIEHFGAHGYTIIDARGKGAHGVRSARWEADRNIHIEIICDEQTADAILNHLQERYFKHYAVVAYITDVQVLRPEKF
jgi:nitrogen regulatory protein PII